MGKRIESANFFEDLVKYFENTPEGQIKKDWEATKEFDNIGITVDEFLAQNKEIWKMIEQKKLFDIPEKKAPKGGLTCRTCIYRYKHQYGKMFYCRKQRQKGTAYGDKKIKAGDSACFMYES